uniref:EF-hand domain-containing protein n=1 Tax=Plectus sambesii TaxID=2011161 RepID=A0A914VX70_9BILA
MNSSRSSMGALPAHFVDAMRVLFDIMDTDRTGYIRFDDLARKWKHLPPAAPNVPPGFLNCLHKVTPPNGMLTFERFCAGLRLALAENRTRTDGAVNGHAVNGHATNGHASLQRVASEGHLVADHSQRDSRRAPPPSSNGQPSSLEKKKVPMGLAAKLENRRSMQAFGSTPSVNRASASSTDQWPQQAMMRNGAHSQQAIDNYENIDVIMREKKNKLPSRWTNGQAKQSTQSPTTVPPAYALYQQNQQHQQKGRQAVPPPPPPMPTIERLADGSHPQRVDAHQPQPQQRGFRPISAISTGSGASTNSSGAPHSHPVGEGSVRWRDRSRMTNVSDGRRHTMSEENAPKVVR